MSDHLLSILVFLPVVSALAVFVLGDGGPRTRWIALGGSLATLAVSLAVLSRFDSLKGDMQLVEKMAWIPSLNIRYALGIDGIALWLVILTTVLTPVVIASSFASVEKRIREYHVFLLLLEAGMLGAFVALDVFLFYVFWEAMLVPMYFLIGVWGGERRVYAAVKFFLYTAVGSLLMLLAILWVYLNADGTTALWQDLVQHPIPRGAQMWLFAAFGLAFAIKVPMLPFHTWLPDAHVEAPTGGSVILAGVLLKMGTFGFLRWAMPLFPEAAVAFSPLILALAAAGVIYGALVAMVQPDMKKFVAYSSVSHLGYVMLGLFAIAARPSDSVAQVSGAVLQMVNHGLSTGALFLLVGILYERRHTRAISDYGGIARTMPAFAAVFLLVTLSSIGLPGTNGFVGEFLILIGTFQVAKLPAILGALGVVLGAVYMLLLYQRTALGPITKPENEKLADASRRELLYLLPVLAGILWIGLAPKPFLKPIESSVDYTLKAMEKRMAPPVATIEVTP